MKENYSYHPETGEYLGAIPFSGNPGALPPRFTTPLCPDCITGHIPVWNGKEWEQIENHRGEFGYVDGKPVRILELGPLPDGWMTELPMPEPEPQDPADAKKSEIRAELDAIDREAIRPLRAIAAGNGTDDDTAKLQKLDTRAAELRAELATLTA